MNVLWFFIGLLLGIIIGGYAVKQGDAERQHKEIRAELEMVKSKVEGLLMTERIGKGKEPVN